MMALGCSDAQPPAPESDTSTSAVEGASTPSGPEPGETVAASWSGGYVYLSDIDQVVKPEQLMQTIDLQGRAEWPDVIASKRREAVDTLVNNYILNAEAHARGLTISDAEKDAMLSQFKSTFETEDDYREQLAQAGQSEEQMINTLVNLRLNQKCLEEQKEAIRQGITPEQIKAYYEEQIDRFTRPALSEINRIVILADDETSMEEAKTETETLYAEVKALVDSATDFAAKRKVMQEYAYKHSDTPDASYNYGYCILYHTPDVDEAFGAEFVEEVLETPVGELSPVVPAAGGYGFFLVKKKTESVVQPFDEPTTQNLLPQMMMVERFEEWRDSLRERYEVQVFEDALRSELPEGALPQAETKP